MAITELRQRGADWSRLANDRQRKHLLEVLKDPNRDWTAAAIRVGYAKKSASVTASRLKNNPIVKAIIGKIERQDVEELGLNRLETLKQLYFALTRQARMFVNPETGLALLPHELPEEVQSIVDGFEQEVTELELGDGLLERKVKMKYKLTPHATAREQAMKHGGLFEADAAQHQGDVIIQVLNQDRSNEPNEIDLEIKGANE